MTKDEALELALEALEEAWYHVGTFQPTNKAIDLYDEARTAIKEALAQPEPVMHTLNCVCGAVWDIKTDGSEEMVHTPYTTPPQRKPLTDEQKMALCKQFPDHLTFNAIHAIEAAHNIKE